MRYAFLSTAITLSRGDQQSNVILRQDIEPDGLVSTEKSLMPEGLEKNVSYQDMTDLLSFLTHWPELERAGTRLHK